MNCWEALEKKARIARDAAAEALQAVRGQIETQEQLLERTGGIADSYRQKIGEMQSVATHFGDLQLYRTSLKQLQQAMFQIEQELTRLRFEAGKRQKELTRTEVERQKYAKLVEREIELQRQAENEADARDLDELAVQLHHRKRKLA
jgi:flagellar export protein FliJ